MGLLVRPNENEVIAIGMNNLMIGVRTDGWSTCHTAMSASPEVVHYENTGATTANV